MPLHNTATQTGQETTIMFGNVSTPSLIQIKCAQLDGVHGKCELHVGIKEQWEQMYVLVELMAKPGADGHGGESHQGI